MDLYDILVAKALSGSGGGEPVIEALSVTENGTYTAPSGVDGYSPVTVNVSGGGGGGGTEVESGVWTPTENTKDVFIQFSKTHEVPPAFLAIVVDTAETTLIPQMSIGCYIYANLKRALGNALKKNNSVTKYGVAWYIYRTTNAFTTDGQASDITYGDEYITSNPIYVYSRYYVQEDGFFARCTISNVYYAQGTNYKWIAVWTPSAE